MNQILYIPSLYKTVTRDINLKQMNTIRRNIYLNRLITRRHNHRIKIVTGVRRSGKSFLLFNLFSEWLLANGVEKDNILRIDLEDRRNKTLRNPDALLRYIDSKMTNDSMYYILIDEVQLVDEFEDVLNSYLKIANADIYVTGSNARFLSKDIATTFRGRGDVVHIYPLSFSEYHSAFNRPKEETLVEYLLYGGLPETVSMTTDEEKVSFLRNVYEETYIKDILDRYNIKQENELEILFDIVSSTTGSLTNPQRISNTFASVHKNSLSAITVKKYLDIICESFLLEKVSRFDVKGRKYIDSPFKYYFADPGLRNVRMNFRQPDFSHVMENVIYNELRRRGYNVDVGVVPVVIREEGRQTRKQYEIDFVCNLGSRRYYIQSAYRMADDAKIAQEEASLRSVDDSFKKILIVGEHTPVMHNDAGIATISIYDFLLNPDSLEL